MRDNRVGANKVAKLEARRWVNEVSGEALFDCYLTVRSREVSLNDFTKPGTDNLQILLPSFIYQHFQDGRRT